MRKDVFPRDLLAERAAGQRSRALLDELRALHTAELLAAPPVARCCDLNDAVAQAGEALQQAVRRRAGWLYVAPADGPLPTAQSARRVQAALFCFAEGVLRSGTGAGTVLALRRPGGALLVLRGGRAEAMPREFFALWRGLARPGAAVATQRGAFGAAALAPLCAGAAARVPTAQELLLDRYSPLYLYLPGRCAQP